MSRAVRGEIEDATVIEHDADETPGSEQLPQARYAEMSAAEQFVLTISEKGYGKRTSSFEYRITGRGGKGIVAMAVNERNGELIASFPVEDTDQIMLVTDGGQMIRMLVGGDKPIRIVGRSSQGVIVFNTNQKEKVVSVDRLTDVEDGDPEADAEAEAPNGSGVPPAPDQPGEPDAGPAPDGPAEG